MARKIISLLTLLSLASSSILFTRYSSVEAVVGHVVISEVQVSGVDDPNLDFIELYNPTSGAVDLSDMKIVKRTRTGTSDANIVSFVAGDSIPAYGYYVWCSTPFAAQTTCDRTTSATIANNNSIALRIEPSDTGEIVDAVTIGTVDNNLGEGVFIDPDPVDGGSIERKALSSSTIASMTTGGSDEHKGNGEDTNSNSIDFLYRETSEPQNSTSALEMVDALNATNTPEPSITTSPTPSLLPTPTDSADTTAHIVISEVQVGGALSTDEFIEMYNPTNESIDVTGWKLQKKTASGSTFNDLAMLSGSIASQGYYLVAHTDYAGATSADTTYTEQSLSANNTVQLLDGVLQLIDKVGMGTATDFEGIGTASSPANGRSIERKAHETSSAATMGPGGEDEFDGNGYDSNDNDTDFILRAADAGVNPQNTQSQSEPVDTSVSPIPTHTPTHTPSPTQEPSAEPTQVPTVTLTATSTPTSMPTEYPSSTPTPTDTPTAVPTQEPTMSPTSTPIPTETPTITPTYEPTIYPTSTPTTTIVPTMTSTPEPTGGITPSVTPTPSPSLTPTPQPDRGHHFSRILGTSWFFGSAIQCRHEYTGYKFGWYRVFFPRLVCERLSHDRW